MRLQSVTVTKQTLSTAVEILFADNSDREQAIEFLHVRQAVGLDGHPSVEEYELAALQPLQTVLGDEIERLKHILGRF